MARSSFSGAMLGRPSLACTSYIPANSASIFPSASLTIWRIARSGWSAGTKSSKRCSVNRLSVKVSAPRMGKLGLSRVRKGTASDYPVRQETGRLCFLVFQRPARCRARQSLQRPDAHFRARNSSKFHSHASFQSPGRSARSMPSASAAWMRVQCGAGR